MIPSYPAGPESVPDDLTRPGAAYRRNAWIAGLGLALFVLLYLALAAWFGWTAYRLLDSMARGGRDGIMLFLVGSCALFMAVFMVKALFFVRRGSPPDALEVTQRDQPRLFAFLHRLADEAGAPRPHRVFLSARVNAAVFYDLSLLNLILPSRKNLEMGLALVNVLTLSEMKAVLAHEYGHFAQRTMAIGSWVYVAQQIAAAVVSRRDALDRVLQMLSRTDVRLAWLGWLLSLIVWSIRSLVDTLLQLVILAQRALSREMEFQADLVAVSLTGSDELVHALHKLHAADDAWGRTLAFANSQLAAGKRPRDLFELQTRVIGHVGTILSDSGYGVVPPEGVGGSGAARRIFRSAFARPPEMWATHPANSDREENAKRRYVAAPHDARSAWVLFDNVESLRADTANRLFGEQATVPLAPDSEMHAALDAAYLRLPYDPCFRGAYLGRPLTLHASAADDLTGGLEASEGAMEALSALYPEALGADLKALEELEQERTMLEALRDRRYVPADGRIAFRGREISRRELPSALRDVIAELDVVRGRVIGHDRRCRAAHIAVAARLGGGWDGYLRSLLALLHYAEHTLADLQDARGAFNNTFAIVTADGKVSSRELERLVRAANELRQTMAAVLQQRDSVEPDAQVLSCMGASSWSAILPAEAMVEAVRENIGQWLDMAAPHCDGLMAALSSLKHATLETLLATERRIAEAARGKEALQAPPAPGRVPGSYALFTPGSHRKLQTRLGWWDRFKLADGLLPAAMRFGVSTTIVVAVLGFTFITGRDSQVAVFNSLATTVEVSLGDRAVTVPAGGTVLIDVELDPAMTITARDARGQEIESFVPPLQDHVARYAYNVGGAAVLAYWTATYGNASAPPPELLGNPRWFETNADVLFEEPPESVSTKGGGAVRKVLSGITDRPPLEVLGLIEDESERARVVAMHLRWDDATAPEYAAWRALGDGH